MLVRADAGEYGPFVRIKQDETWIILSVKQWEFLCQQMELINKALNEQSHFGTTFCATKGLRVSHVKGSSTVTFAENKIFAGKKYDKALSMNKSEWETLFCLSSSVTDVLNDVVAYSKTDFERWHFTKEACGTSKLRYRLVPRLAKPIITSLMYGNLVSNAITDTVRKMCYGCQVNDSNPIQHMSYGCGCLAPWNEMVECHYDECKDKIDAQAAAAKVNAYMDWKLEANQPESDALRQLILDMGNLRSANIACVYNQCFEDIGLRRFALK